MEKQIKFNDQTNNTPEGEPTNHFHSYDGYGLEPTFINNTLANISKRINLITIPTNKQKHTEEIIDIYYRTEIDLFDYINQLKLTKEQSKLFNRFIRENLYEHFFLYLNINSSTDSNNNKLQSFLSKLYQLADSCIIYLTSQRALKGSFDSINLQHIDYLSETRSIKQLLKGIQMTKFADLKSFLFNQLNVNRIPFFILFPLLKRLKKEIFDYWNKTYKQPAEKLKLHNDYNFKILNQTFLDLINNKINLFDKEILDDNLRFLLFKFFLFSNKGVLLSYTHSRQTFLNNTQKYILLLHLKEKYSEILEFLYKFIENGFTEKELDKLINDLNENLINELFSDFNIMGSLNEIKYFHIIFSFSISLNNILIPSSENPNPNSNSSTSTNTNDKTISTSDLTVFTPSTTFNSELVISAREKSFLMNFLKNFDKIIQPKLKDNSNPNSNSNLIDSAINLDKMIEQHILSQLFKSYSKILFNENDNFNQHKRNFSIKTIKTIVSSFSVSDSIISEFQLFLKRKFQIQTSPLLSDFSNLFNIITKNIKYNDIEIILKENEIILEPIDLYKICTNICICIPGNIKNIKSFLSSLAEENENNDYYIFNWKNESNSFLNKIIKNFSEKLKIEEETEQLSTIEIIEKNLKMKKMCKLFGDLLAYIISSRLLFKFHTITLVADGQGCSIVKYFLLRLFKLYESNPDLNDVIQNVVLLGGMTTFKNKTKWAEIFELVSGRIYNCFSENDRSLRLVNVRDEKFIGLNKIELKFDNNLGNLVNVDLSDEINLKDENQDYSKEISRILKKINFSEI